jgi:hypothetical protein
MMDPVRGAKDYIITDPIGQQKVVTNLSQFCRDNQLNRSKMHAVARGAAKAHKGFKISRTMK